MVDFKNVAVCEHFVEICDKLDATAVLWSLSAWSSKCSWQTRTDGSTRTMMSIVLSSCCDWRLQ